MLSVRFMMQNSHDTDSDILVNTFIFLLAFSRSSARVRGEPLL